MIGNRAPLLEELLYEDIDLSNEDNERDSSIEHRLNHGCRGLIVDSSIESNQDHSS